MSMKHLRKGDAVPPVNPEKLRIYSMHYCPFAQRARLVLTAKGIDFEVVNCNLTEKPEFLLERNASGKVPVLEYRGHVVPESLIVSELIDDLYPEKRPLTAKDPFRRAADRLIVENYGQVIGALYGMLFGKPDDPAPVEKMKTALSNFQEVIKKRDTPFLNGDEVGMPDLMVWPWLERTHILRPTLLAHTPELSRYVERMNQDPAVKSCNTDPAVMRKFTESAIANKTNYDLEYAY